MASIVLAHGAWSAGWAWKKMRPLMRAAGHEFFSPTYTGLGERAHLARPDIDLSTHIQDVLAVLEFEDLKDVTLLGHSYGGMVATGVADKAADRIARVVYIDAFAPKDGQSLFDLVGPEGRGQHARRARPRTATAGSCRSIPMPPDTAPEDAAWAVPRRRPQPIKTFEQKIKLAVTSTHRRAITSTPRRTGRATCSASSATGPRASPAGSITRSTPATTRTSPAPMC